MFKGKDDKQRKVIIDALVQMEVQFSKSKAQQWPSLFSNLIEPRKKNLSSARQLYESLTDEQIELRFAIHDWEAKAWDIYESLMGCSLLPLSYSIEPKMWAKRELLNVKLLLEEGKNQLMTSTDDFCLHEIPRLYNPLLTGKWGNFISIDELKRFSEAESEYAKDHNFDLSDIASIRKVDFNIRMARPREEHFLNRTYIAAQEIQALVWYKEFLKEIIYIGITFYPDDPEDNKQDNKPKRKFVDIKNLKRSNDGYEAITVSFNNFNEAKSRIPNWSELMAYMAEHPPIGFIITASYKGGSVSELFIEGIEKPIDREAFRKRYDRYFPKPDIKPDIS